MNKTIKYYYIALALVIVTRVGTTIFNNGLLISQSAELTKLTIQNKNLIAQKTAFQSKLAAISSLKHIDEQIDMTEYIKITQTITLTENTSVASSK